MNLKKKSFWIGAFSITWVFVIILIYYVSHKPFTAALAVSLGWIIWRLFLAAGLVSIAGGIGAAILRRLNLHPLARLAVQAGLGLGLISLLYFLAGSIIGLTGILAWIVPLLPGLLCIRYIPTWWKQWSALGEVWTESGRFERFLGILLAVLGISALILALAPPIKYDALMYHLTMPSAYLQAGKVEYLPWIVMTGMPQITEMLYTWAMSLGGAQGAAVLGCSFGLLTAVGLLGYLRQRLNVKAAWGGLAALFAGYTLAIAQAWAYVDWLGLFFGFCALVLLDAFRQEGVPWLAAAAGVFAGFAFGTKYTAGVLGLVCSIAFLWHMWKRKSFSFRAILFFLLGAIFTAAPWLIKNWITTGSPVYPFFFAAGEMDAVRISVYQGLPSWGNWQDIVLLPLRATYLGIDSADGYSVSIGPLLLGLAVFAGLGRKNRTPEQLSALQNAAVMGIAGLLVWIAGNQVSGYLIQTRMYFSIFPAFAVLAAYGFDGLQNLRMPALRLDRIVSILIGLVLALNALEVGLEPWERGSVQAALGMKDEASYLADNLGWFEPALQAVNELPEGSRVKFIYEPRGYYCLPTCDPDEILDEWKYNYIRYGSGQAVLEHWKEEGVTHLLFNKLGADFLKTANDPHHLPSEIAALEDLLSTLPAPQDFGDSYLLYTLP